MLLENLLQMVIAAVAPSIAKNLPQTLFVKELTVEPIGFSWYKVDMAWILPPGI